MRLDYTFSLDQIDVYVFFTHLGRNRPAQVVRGETILDSFFI